MEKIKSLWNTFVTSLKEDKKFRIRTIVIAAVVVVVIAAIIIACVCAGGNEQNPDTTNPSTQITAPSQTEAPDGMMDFSVTVTDGNGEPVPGVIVNFMLNGSVAAMQQTDADGVAVKNLAGGDYTIELAFTDSSANYTYDTEAAVVSVDSSTITIVLYNALGAEVKELYAYSATEDAHKDYSAYFVTEGSTFVNLDTSDRTYFIFVPTRDGVYQFSTNDSSVQLGYFGSTYFVQANNLAENNEDGSFTIDIAPGMVNVGSETGTMSMVIGIDSASSKECVLTIERTGEHVMTIDEYPWDIYETTVELSPFELAENINLIDFDVTASSDTYQLVFNEADGFYHLDTVDGPLVYVKLGVESAYLDSLQAVVENSGVNRYFFDENGEFISKESYTECLMEYMENMDQTAGIYPLTEDLKYIIQQRGEYVGWWDPDSMTYIFCDDDGKSIIGLNTDIAWLFICCYGDGVQEVVSTEPTEPDSTVGNNENSGATSSGATSGSSGNSNSGSSSGNSSSGSSGSSSNNSSSGSSGNNSGSSSGGSSSGSSGNNSGSSSNGSSSGSSGNNSGSSSGGSSSGSAGNNSGSSSGSSGNNGSEDSTSGNTENTDPAPTEKPEDEKTVGTQAMDENGDAIVYENGLADELETEVIPAGYYVQYTLWRYSAAFYLTIESEDAYVIYDNKEYWPDENGVITVSVPAPNMQGGCLNFYVGNSGAEDQTFTMYMGTKVGSMGNPKKVTLDSNNQKKLTIQITDEDVQGYWCSYTATADGVFSVTLNSSINAEISLTNNSTYEQVLLSECEGDTVQIAVSSGDVISIVISVASASGSGSNYDVSYEDAVVNITAALK